METMSIIGHLLHHNKTQNAIYLAGDTGHPLGNKWQDSEDYRILINELDPILDKAIDQPDGIAPKYATNPLTQVSAYCQLIP